MPGGAVAALEAIMLDKGRLHGVKIIWRTQAFNGGDLGPLMHDCKRQAGIKPATIDQHGTGSALSVIATFLGTDQMQIFTQSVQ